ncbi:antithrombin-III [Heptranchias perlo]|uniref:antithrombin-III n=1 Tax=Heptranchias perlo TaxID=212740 RepID=UPI003559E270
MRLHALFLCVVLVGASDHLSDHNSLSHCNTKLKDIPGQPMCVYRSPDKKVQPVETGGGQGQPKAKTLPGNTNPRVWELSRANSRFAIEFYKQLADSKSNEENIFMSPLSISTAFAMTKLGACGDTLQQLMQNLFVQGLWKSMFEKEMTVDRVFERTSNSSCQVPMMQQQSSLRFGKFPEDKVKVIELPYKGDDVSMVLILPTGDGTLLEVEKQLEHEKILGWLNRLRVTDVDLSVPRFRVEDTFSLTNKLKQMGLVDLFSPKKANLAGLVEGTRNDLYVSDAFHKAYLEVNEEGSEAAAASAVIVMGRSLRPSLEVFNANRPFILLIREVAINAIIFMGRIFDPCPSSQ